MAPDDFRLQHNHRRPHSSPGYLAPAQRCKLAAWFNSGFFNAGTPDTNVIVVGTVFHRNSLLANLQDPTKSPAEPTALLRGGAIRGARTRGQPEATEPHLAERSSVAKIVGMNFGAAAGLQRARFDFSARRFRGYAWSENIGWVNLDHASQFVALPPPCPGDVDGDRMVGLADIAVLVGTWNQTIPPAPAAADLDNSGTIGLGDIAAVIAHWGAICP